jgi:hypothetical protein
MFDPQLLFVVNDENELIPYNIKQNYLETAVIIFIVSTNIIIISIICLVLYALLEVTGIIKMTIELLTQLFYYADQNFIEILTTLTSVITFISFIMFIVQINNDLDNTFVRLKILLVEKETRISELENLLYKSK